MLMYHYLSNRSVTSVLGELTAWFRKVKVLYWSRYHRLLFYQKLPNFKFRRWRKIYQKLGIFETREV